MRILFILLLLPQFLLLLTAKNWKLWPSTTSNKPYTTTDGVAFDFPQAPETVNYFLTNFSRDVSVSVSARFRITMSTGAMFTYQPNGCDTPPSTRLYLERKGWDANNCNWNDPNTPCQYRRWFSNPANYTLTPGEVTITVPLDPGQWSSVYGRFGTDSPEAQAGFYDALRNLQRVGLPF